MIRNTSNEIDPSRPRSEFCFESFPTGVATCLLTRCSTFRFILVIPPDNTLLQKLSLLSKV